MDSVVIGNKLESLRRCVVRIEEKRPDELSILVGSLDLQDILVLNLSRAIQICVDIGSHIVSSSEHVVPKTMAETFSVLLSMEVISESTEAALRKAVGFRNIAVHNYEVVNWAIVFAIATQQVEIFKQFAAEVASYCDL
jgi:uncharacterized protein YutE (UPF0331/DUF86 family)